MKFLRLSYLLSLLSIAALPLRPAHAQTGASSNPVIASVTAQPGRLTLMKGKGLIRLQMRINPKFHINANPADEGLVPTLVQLNAQNGLVFGKPQYPTAQKRSFPFTLKPISVYAGTVEIQIPVTVTAKAINGIVKGSVRYQACNDHSCFLPAQAPFQLEVTAGGPANAVSPGTMQQNTAPPQSAANGTAASSADADATALRDRYGVRGLPTVIFLDSAGRERADLRSGEELTQESFAARLQALCKGAPAPTSESSALGWGARLGAASFGWQLVLVFIGGLLLNLTPCVYPMIPITVGYFGNQAEGKASRTFGLALLYVLGLALVYSVLGVTAALTGSLFGSLMQSPGVVGAVAVVLFAFGLSMLGLFTIQPPAWALARGGAKKGAMGALAMGALLGIVAAPCVGPAVAALLTYVAARHDPVVGFTLFFFLSLGLGFPYLLLGALGGAARSALPRSGAWMVKAKKIFAIPILAAAAYFAFTAFNTARVTTSDSTTAWPRASLAALSGARAAGNPVVLDFRADWCLPCREMEHKIFAQQEIKSLAAASHIQLHQVDLTRAQS